MRIYVKRTRELDSKIAKTISSLDERHFGKVPIVQKYQWSETDWTIYSMKDKKMVSCAKIVERIGKIGSTSAKIGGVNNVITLDSYRGQGLSSAIMQRVNRMILEDLECKYGLLFCATELIPFYSKLGWSIIKSDVYFAQPSGKVRWEAETMLLCDKKLKADPKSIDLCGLPW